MKTKRLLPAGFICAILAVQTWAAPAVVADWSAELSAVQQASHQDAGGRARAGDILRAVDAAARNGLESRASSDRPAEPVPEGVSRDAAVAHAVYSAMAVLYPQSLPSLDDWLAASLAGIDDTAPAVAAGKAWGEHVAQIILSDQGDAVFLNNRSFAATAEAITGPLPDAQAEEQQPIGPGRYRFSLLAGTPGTQGYVDAAGAAARFAYPGGIAVDAAHNVYVSEFNSFTVRKISPSGGVTTLAGAAQQKGSQDGTGAAARFNAPRGLTVDGAGNLFVADTENHTIRKISPEGVVTTVTGTAGSPGVVDGNRNTARLDHPLYLTLDNDGNLLVTENYNPKSIRKVAPDGAVTTLTIKSDLPLLYPFQIAIGPAGKLYVSYRNNADFHDPYFYGVVKLTPNSTGGYDGSALVTDSSLAVDPWAYGMAIDASGNLIIDYNAPFLAVYTPAGEFQRRYITGPPDFFTGGEMAVAPNGDVFTASIWGTPHGLVNGGIHVGVFDPTATGPVILWGPADADRAVGGAVKFTVSALGGGPLSYQWYFNSSAISGATQATVDLSAVKLSDAGKYYVVVSDRDGSVTSDSANLGVSEPATPVTGTATSSTVATPPGGSGATSGTGAATSGGGSFGPSSGAAVLLLFALASRRRRKSPATSLAPLAPGHPLR